MMKKKSEIINIVIAGYEKLLKTGSIETIETYLYNNKKQIYKDINFDATIYSKTVEDHLKYHDLIQVNTGSKEARFSDYELDNAIYNYKIEKLSEFDLSHIEDFIAFDIINFHDRQMEPYRDKIGINYLNVFNNYQRERIQSLIPSEMFAGLNFTKREVLDYFFNERKGYETIIKNIAYYSIKHQLKNFGYNSDKTDIDVRTMEGKNKWKVECFNLEKESSFIFYIAFKDAQYWYFNETDYDYSNEFNLLKIIPNLNSCY